MPGFEVEDQMLVIVNHDVADHGMPERIIEFQFQRIEFMKCKQASADLISLNLPPFLQIL